MSKKRPAQNKLRKRWIEKNPPDENGYYECWICKWPVHVSKMTIDHILSAREYPEYRTDHSNLRPAHDWCNNQRSQEVKQTKRYGSSSLQKHFRYGYRKRRAG